MNFNDYREIYETKIVSAMTAMKIPGLSVAIVKDSEIVYQRGFGARDRERQLTFTPDTLVGTGSCTKPFTALAIMQLVAGGKIKLDDPVVTYLPRLKLGTAGNPITIRHLLTHTSGVPALDSSIAFIRNVLEMDSPPVPLANIDDYYLFLNGARSEIHFAPGEKFFYCMIFGYFKKSLYQYGNQERLN